MDFGAKEIGDFTRLKRLREAGYFEDKGTEPMPEIVADGQGPDDGWLRPTYEFDYTQVEQRAMHSYGHDPWADAKTPAEGDDVGDWKPPAQKYADTTMYCSKCQRETAHGQVAIFVDTCNPVFHCNTCCECHLCRERPSSQAHRYAQGHPISPKGMASLNRAVEGTETGRIAPTFCEDCGAMLRCGVCVGEGPGGYCYTCGRREDGTGRCPSCWKGD